jgi:DNA (cytosine-5)-methyltransferase 1
MILKVADLFAGAGGSSTGAKRAIAKLGGEMDLVAVNHWRTAVSTHSYNHPNARHYCITLDAARPEDLVPDGGLDLLLASPECTHHSRARGGKPVNDQRRSSAWHIPRWASVLRIPRILLENVPEFIEWGPIDELGNPIKERKGEYYLAFIASMRALGYDVEWRIVNAADYGDATTRKRWFCQLRNDGKPIVWPEPTHDQYGRNGLPKWRSARGCIDWTLPDESLFERKRPLSSNTMARVELGLQTFTGKLAPLFIRLARGEDVADYNDDTLTKDEIQALVAATSQQSLARDPKAEPMAFLLGNSKQHAPRGVNRPVMTITANGGRSITLFKPTLQEIGSDGAKLDAFMVACNHTDKGARAGRVYSLNLPFNTITTKRSLALIQPRLSENGSGKVVRINGTAYRVDIRSRMLQPIELQQAMGFGRSYAFAGTKTEATIQIGNAVPVETSSALVGAMLYDIAEARSSLAAA